MISSRILFIIDTLGRGGAEQVLASLVPYLDTVRCELICLMEPSPLAAEFESHGIKVHHFKLSHRWNCLEFYFKFKKLIRLETFPVIHGHLFFGGLYAYLARKMLSGSKTILTLHSLEFERDQPDTLWHALRLKIRKKVLVDADKLIAISESVKVSYAHALNRSDISVISNPVKLYAYDNYVKNKQDSFNLCMPARLIPEKGHSTLLAALDLLKKERFNFKCSLVGEGPKRSDIEREIQKYKLEAYVFLRGEQTHQATLLEVSKSDLIVLPSLSEGFGLAAAEAMGLGKLVIASRVGGLQDLIQHQETGILFDPGNAIALADEIRAVILNRYDHINISLNAKKMINDQFSVQKIAKQWLSTYAEVLR